MRPIVFMNGDGGVGEIAPIVYEKLYSQFPIIEVPLTVSERLSTKDSCIQDAVDGVLEYGAGFKNSTASADPRIKAAGMKSANILLRPKLGAYAILRLLHKAIRYERVCGTLRYAHGSFYDEQSCKVEIINGRRTAVTVTHMDLEDLVPYSELGIEIARKFGLKLILSSKSTIADSEALFRSEVETVLIPRSVELQHKLTDIALAELPVVTALGGSAEGGFLHLADNANGDSSSDIIDHQNGGFVMGSDVYCLFEGKKFVYHELPGGTADDYLNGTLPGRNFLNPSSIIYQLAGAFESVNPSEETYFNAIRQATSDYLDEVDQKDRHTMEMLDYVSEKLSIFTHVPAQ